MIRLRILVEGDTEEAFVNAVLLPHLLPRGVYAEPLPIGLAKGRRGIVRWQSARRRIINSLKESGSLCVTTMVDYYGIDPDWPGVVESRGATTSQKGAVIAARLSEDISAKLEDKWRPNRFIPFVMMHEFEALLFANPASASKALGLAQIEGPMKEVTAGFDSPEDINDAPQTAPSKRLEAIFQACGLGNYDKPLHGNIAALEIGLGELRERCPQFGAWLTKIEQLGKKD